MTPEAALDACAALTDPKTRLQCFDEALQALRNPPPQPSPLLEELSPPSRRSLIGERWAIGAAPADSRFDLRPHRPSYFLPLRYSSAPNQTPQSPTQPPAGFDAPLNAVEAKFQISFKVKLADFMREFGGALWAGYTQQSQWQVYNDPLSRPFRETNYEPEVMLAFHPDRELLGWRWRLFTLGLNHQSNGRSDPFSRSWNRLNAQFGVERGRMAIIVRPWWRLPEQAARDDNPDIVRYMGRGDVIFVVDTGQNTISLLTRYNPSSGKGAAQAGWSFPIARRLRGSLQYFSGYGESLIDYNVRQNTIGVGISLADHL